QAGELFDLLERLGGTAEATADALTRLVGLVRPQLDELRKAGKGEDATKLAESVSTILVKQSAKPNLSPRVLAFLGRSLRDLGVYTQAVEVLLKIPTPAMEDLKKPLAQLDEKTRPLVTAYTSGQLELARAYRANKQFEKSDEVLVAAIGKDGKSGWARPLDFRKEAALLLEDKADAAPAEAKLKAWSEAQQAWTKIVTDYQRAVVTPPKKAEDRPAWERDREKIIPIFLGTFADLQRCLSRANAQIMKDPMKLAEKQSGIGKKIAELEAAQEKYLTPDVKTQFSQLMTDYPNVKAGYEKAGGKAFLSAP
ncbi:MAG: hypothetical protein ACRCZF_22195, partial [Gemmataceae bacterium]